MQQREEKRLLEILRTMPEVGRRYLHNLRISYFVIIVTYKYLGKTKHRCSGISLTKPTFRIRKDKTIDIISYKPLKFTPIKLNRGERYIGVRSELIRLK